MRHARAAVRVVPNDRASPAYDPVMASVLSFEEALRRRTPAWARRAIVGRTTPRGAFEFDAGRVTEAELAQLFLPIAALVVAADLATKAWAVTALAGARHTIFSWLSLTLVFNGASAGGVWLGDNTRAINFAATGIVVGLLVAIVPALARIDRRSTIALALAAGGGVGNLVSLAEGGRGVPDFIAIHHLSGAWVINVADIGLVVGLALLARTVVLLVKALRTAV